jgi:hypothetical protein
MRTIWKYRLPVQDRVELEMPAGAEILTVASDTGEPCLWAAVDSEQPKTKRILHIVGTGHPMPPESTSWWYIGTFFVATPVLVFHVFTEGV